MEIRIGLPLTGGALVAEAKRKRMPVLFSANAFTRRNREDRRVRFQKPRPGRYEGLDAALDSAGFVAMSTYNGYDWSIEQYMELAASHRWTWYAQMDCCCEPELAANHAERMLRLAETARLYAACAKEAVRRGIAPPMPVLQGWSCEDYKKSADMLPVSEWPGLIGIGSVCRREVSGPDGVVSIVEALDRFIPTHVRMHLFGVKGQALEVLAGHPRVSSIDSMAWDMAARRKWPTGRTMARRITALHQWRESQIARCDQQGAAIQTEMELSQPLRDEAGDEGLSEWIELIADGEIEMQSAACHWARESCWSFSND